LHIDLSRKVAVITGAGRGIGEALARRMGQEGARVALVERSEEGLARVSAVLAGAGIEALPILCDVSHPDAVAAAVHDIVGRLGGIDILVNNAGIAPEASIERMTPEEWDETFAVNTRGVFLCTRAAIPHMKRARSGRILSASSFAAVIPSIGFAAYSASKAAVVTFTRVLAAELGPWGITANAYTPGMVPTPLNGYADAPSAKQERLLNTLSLRRWGSADDIASLLIFLASDHASYITGTSIEISGGKYAVQFPQLAYEQAR
jgi:3-oxoacyl-[acyl-carrier protein] reductase